MPNGRTGQQCAQRWRHKVNPEIRKDKWTDNEDAKVRRTPSLRRTEWAPAAALQTANRRNFLKLLQTR